MDYYNKYRKYKGKYLGGKPITLDTPITENLIHPIGCFGEYENERLCFLVDVPEYTAYNGVINNKLPFYISTGTSGNNRKLMIVPFNGMITFPQATDRKYNIEGEYDGFASLKKFNNRLKHMHEQRIISEEGKRIVSNTSNIDYRVKELLVKNDPIMDVYMDSKYNEVRMIIFNTWAIKIKDALDRDLLRDYYPTTDQINSLDLTKEEKIKVSEVISTLNERFENLHNYNTNILNPFVKKLNDTIKVKKIDLVKKINTITFQYTNGTEFIKRVPCEALYSKRNINKQINTNNIYGIDLSALNLIIPLTQYKKLLYELKSKSKLDEIAAGNMTFREILSEGNMPTLTDILYNLFICISGDDSHHWCK